VDGQKSTYHNMSFFDITQMLMELATLTKLQIDILFTHLFHEVTYLADSLEKIHDFLELELRPD